MKYISTRGIAPELDFDDVLITGLARDGGLYVPKEWPKFSNNEIETMRELSYADLSIQIMKPFISNSISSDDFDALVRDTYEKFRHPAVAPLKQLENNLWLLELFHGPTLAFKDYAMQILGGLFDEALQRRKKRTTIVGATSGDTGSAAIEAFRNREAIDIFILFPKGRVSNIQQRQMTTVDSSNVHAIALEGTFDDCQDMVKSLFNDLEYRDKYNLSAVNSINWARLLPQIIYYFWAALALWAPNRKVSFSVPSGNFGNVFSAYAAKALGLPIENLVVATNTNDILSRFFNSGKMEIKRVRPSLSPSMDIQVSSNFERLLFDLCERDGSLTNEIIENFRTDGYFDIETELIAKRANIFSACSVDDETTLARIKKTHKDTGEIIDPHSAVGLEAAHQIRSSGLVSSEIPIISLACAHPAKFPDAVHGATGFYPDLPVQLDDLLEKKEHTVVLPDDFDSVANYIADNTNV
ncbi:MAG: threonine synthase [Rhodospirillaceae bacterium]|nr:threonine synthase [Rhodospirillaceae bacterium]